MKLENKLKCSVICSKKMGETIFVYIKFKYQSSEIGIKFKFGFRRYGIKFKFEMHYSFI